MQDNIRSIADLPNYRHLPLGSVGSTNTEAMDRALAGDPGNLWVTAAEQLAGKARRGRGWVSKPGNLYSSLLLVDPAPDGDASTLPLVVSVALHNALLAALPQLAGRLDIKWPNDVLLDGKKLSGILLEAGGNPSGQMIIVIGCGVNCHHFPDNPMYPATSLLESGLDITPEELFYHYAKSMADALKVWAGGLGFATIRDEWLSKARGLGQPLIARFDDHELSGVFKALDADGRLVLEDEDGTEHRIAAADIFFGAGAAFGHNKA